MIQFKTGKTTKGGEEIRLGDILKGKTTHPMVVLSSPELPVFTCYIISINEEKTIYGIKQIYAVEYYFNFPLEEMISTWPDLKVIGNILFH